MCESDRRLTIIIFLLREALPPPLVNFSRIVIGVIGPSRWKTTDFFINKVLSMSRCFGYYGYTFMDPSKRHASKNYILAVVKIPLKSK